MKDFFSGFLYAFSGFKFLTSKGIRLFILGPLVVNTLLFTIIIIIGINEFGELVSWIESQWKWLSWIRWLLWPLFFIITLIVVFFCFSILANLIASPFNGLLSEAAERLILARETSQPDSAGLSGITAGLIIEAILSELRKLVYIVSRALPMLLLFVVPFVQLAAPFIWLIFAAWIMAIEYMEYPLGNHGSEFKEVKKWAASNRKFSLGFGMGITLLTTIPVVNFLAMPVGIISATKIYLAKKDT